MSASSQTLMWQDAKPLAVLCLVAPTRLADYRALQADLCHRVVAQVAVDAPAPVAEVAHGDPQVIAADTVTLLVHASVQPGPHGRPLIAFSLRPFRATTEQTAQLFSAPPRAAALNPDGGAGADVDGAIRAALDETLPWRASPPSLVGQPLY